MFDHGLECLLSVSDGDDLIFGRKKPAHVISHVGVVVGQDNLGPGFVVDRGMRQNTRFVLLTQ